MTEAAAPVRSRPSSVSRAALLAYLALIVYASWFPFSGWHDSGESAFDFLTPAMPRYWTLFDAGINVIGYIPFGLLVVFSLYPRLRGPLAVLVATFCGVLVSGTMEAVQNWLPSRVPSFLDFATNSAGTLAGAIAGALTARTYLDQGRLYKLRTRWFKSYAGQGLVLVALWPLAQIYPQSYLFGHGQLLPVLSGWLSRLTETNIDLLAMMRHDAVMTPEQYWLSETIITACGLTGAALCMLCITRRGLAPRAMLVALLVGAALLARAMASAILLTPEDAWVWMTPGAEGGLIIGALMVAGLAFAPEAAQRRLALLTLVISLLVVNSIPVNPYFMDTLQTWVQGKFLNFNGAARFLGLMWPFFAIWWLLLPSHRLNREESGV